ncbi:recombinase family protein [Saccharopolyspora pogona]|uniref:recombinase family protein n=1 Tax=Saccharopolyspora pogona TaxID=333966 RepID=UPI0037C50BAA
MPARQLPTGTILVDPPKIRDGRTVAYYRVSSADQKDDLTRQVGCVVEEYGTRGISLDATVTEVGSGPNGTRTKLRRSDRVRRRAPSSISPCRRRMRQTVARDGTKVSAG